MATRTDSLFPYTTLFRSCGGHMEKCRMSALTDIFFPDLPRQFAAVNPDPSEDAIDAHFDALDAVIARIRAQTVADGLIRETACRTRAGEAAVPTIADSDTPDLAAALLAELEGVP